ncbi:hypothetical protein RJ640_019991 [Escallonia rubra]|uniref:Uncharacterized protein n=1 Tax=Escallonia rubra TaxID=112253 RepID=A0AA88U1G9_9ASTE|nr:hypothetical protein RJ640_019991 [Escallonia rubra]
MGLETNPTTASSSSAPNTTSTSATTLGSPTPSGKRSRDPEDEVYIDNLHSHKRYLSEIMASSLNGLTVEDSLPETLMDSPARSESMFYFRDESSLQYSPMSEDMDDGRYYESPINMCSSQPDSLPTSPVSPYRYHKFPSGFFSGLPSNSYSLHGCSGPAVSSSQPRQRGSDSDCRFPSSPSDICHPADLRRAALLRSVQMRTQPPGPSLLELSFNSAQEPQPDIEVEGRPCSYMKSLVDESEYQIEEDNSSLSLSGLEKLEKPCRGLKVTSKEESAS